mmetsp:Transcript_18991/g.72519  ORF Transcript_18991/g.72519 Transcript_18991/m.72519 type:complete len:210 (+) Transcript_18991:1459-2088(+)
MAGKRPLGGQRSSQRREAPRGGRSNDRLRPAGACIQKAIAGADVLAACREQYKPVLGRGGGRRRVARGGARQHEWLALPTAHRLGAFRRGGPGHRRALAHSHGRSQSVAGGRLDSGGLVGGFVRGALRAPKRHALHRPLVGRDGRRIDHEGEVRCDVGVRPPRRCTAAGERGAAWHGGRRAWAVGRGPGGHGEARAPSASSARAALGRL